MEKYKDRYQLVDLSEGEDWSSCILTKDVIYLSAISALTLKKRLEDGFLSDAVYTNL